MVVEGVVREWRGDEGWGVLDSPETPGGCWVHFSGIAVRGHREPAPGQRVALEWEAAEQDGYRYRATRVWPRGAEPAVHPHTTVVGGRSGAYRSSLTLSFDDPAGGTVDGGTADAPREEDGSPGWRASSPEDPDCPEELRRLTADTGPEQVLGEVRVLVHGLHAGGSEVRVQAHAAGDVELVEAAIAELQRARRLLGGRAGTRPVGRPLRW
ncbi:cold-shock protein [Kineococcus auxinigenes]|uniref:cold-shock protein n=1 Tax=unclassified Kineococcus TaxID=2621656 RepID=UPI003D7DAC95